MVKTKPTAETKTLGPGKKACPECGEVLGARTMKCPNEKCGHEFTPKIKSAAKTAPLSSMPDLREQLQAEADSLNERLNPPDRKQLEDRLKAIEAILKTY